MNITRHNYEEYFILYMDNELSSDNRRQVELFVKENPDLQEELNLLMQTQLVPDSSFVFASKEQLLKTTGTVSIDTSDYEEWLLLYIDDELTAEQKMAAERFIASHPAAKAELELLQKTKLQPEGAIVFANKEILYRREERVKVMGIRWRRIAVAAALLLAISTTALLVLNNKNNQGEIAAETIEQKKNSQKVPVAEQPNEEPVLINSQVADNTTAKKEKETIQTNNTIAKEKKQIEQKEKSIPYLPVAEKQNGAVVADNIGKKNMNNLPQPVHNPNVNNNTEREYPIAKMDPVKDPLTNLKETNSIPVVTPNNTQPLNNVITAASKVSDDPVDEERPGRKNKLRGFFRKITRTFEKNTNIKATDDEDRLLLGGLAIKL